MRNNPFVYADLSTYDLEIAQKFYRDLFGWSYVDSQEGYLVAYAGEREASGLYETPPKFKAMKMPSFWMSYIEVEKIDPVVAIAREKGGIIELVEESSVGKIALIRDPLGAGFTICEGDQLRVRTKDAVNTLVWNELFVSDLARVKPFYEALFSWQLVAESEGRELILDLDGEPIGAICQLDPQIKGKYEYWSVFFAIDDLQQAKGRALENGGTVVYESSDSLCLADEFGAFFHLVEGG